MATRKTGKRTKSKPVKTAAKKKAPAKAKKPAKPISPAQEAQQITWLILGELKSTQIKFLRVGGLLCDVRDRKLYVSLGFADMEIYAEARLRLGRASYYRYVQVHDWVREFHPKWLEPKPKGFIPELADVANLIWIERELTRKDLSPEKRAALEALQKKALEGRLRDHDMTAVRTKPRTSVQSLKSFLSKTRTLRMRGSQLGSMPPEAIKFFDAAIEVIKNYLATERDGSTGK